MTEIFNQVLPILLLLALGLWMKRTMFISRSTVGDLRKLVVNVTLPAVLFIAFLDIEFRTKHLLVMVVTFGLGVALYWVGKALQPRFGDGHDYFPYLMTGFEAGMLGISLFGAAYGLGAVGAFAVVDLGHELFIWFVLLALLLAKRDGASEPAKLFRSFISSPVIVAIIVGIAANFAGLGESLRSWAVGGGVLQTLPMLGVLTVPLILIVVGYGIQLDAAGLREAVRPVAVRLAILLPLAVLMSMGLSDNILDSDPYAEAALFTLLILPPPFIVPLYMDPDRTGEVRYVNNVLSLHTLASIAIFVAYVVVGPL